MTAFVVYIVKSPAVQQALRERYPVGRPVRRHQRVYGRGVSRALQLSGRADDAVVCRRKSDATARSRHHCDAFLQRREAVNRSVRHVSAFTYRFNQKLNNVFFVLPIDRTHLNIGEKDILYFRNLIRVF
ncbi:unnamed protein product [Macrosiphum euphorbiae]|uniref:Uncharacterized protein n=1 Tax=Macrosiphum euphorbiae TaxID=13131 RepID=A0AAV0WKI1_9HEMI|nr:unnamed protein product [Macrosiphum euphorbiae]